MFTRKFLIPCILLAGCFLSSRAEDPIPVPIAGNEDCRRFDEYYLQGTRLLNDFTRAQCEWAAATEFFKRLHDLRNEVRKVGCRQAYVNIHAFNNDVTSVFDSKCRHRG